MEEDQGGGKGQRGVENGRGLKRKKGKRGAVTGTGSKRTTRDMT